jgi:hypothetical protein
MKQKHRDILRYQIVFLILIALFIAALILNINTGSVKLSVGRIFKIIFMRDSTDSAYPIIWKIRLPRLLTAAVLGGALSLSGFLLQTFFRNPIAGPFVLGISSGAKMLLAVVTIALSGTMTQIPVSLTVAAAFIGSMLSMLLVLVFARKIKNMSSLLVIGIMISNICSAVTDFLINFAKEADIVNLTYWSMGTFSGKSWNDLKISSIIVIITLIVTFFMSKPIGAYQLGEGYAKSMGINIKAFRVVLIVLSSMLSACVTAFAGPIAFVGIAVPHIAKLMFGTAKPIVMIPGVFLTGAIFCMFCDLVARTIFSPTELTLGTVTAAVGAPVVIWLMLKRKSEV